MHESSSATYYQKMKKAYEKCFWKAPESFPTRTKKRQYGCERYKNQNKGWLSI